MSHTYSLSFAAFLTLFIGIALFSVGTPAHALTWNKVNVCNLPATDKPDEGYASTIDLFSARETPLGVVYCDRANNAEVYLGNGKDTTLIYKYGYHSTPEGEWKRVEYQGDRMKGNWIVGEATLTTDSLYDGLSGFTKARYLVAYMCQKVDGEWKCGCRDKSCRGKYWQLYISTPRIGLANIGHSMERLINDVPSYAGKIQDWFKTCRAEGRTVAFNGPGTLVCPGSRALSDVRWEYGTNLKTYGYEVTPAPELEEKGRLPFRLTSNYVNLDCDTATCNLKIKTRLSEEDIQALSVEERKELIVDEADQLQAVALSCMNTTETVEGEARLSYDGPGSTVCDVRSYNPTWPDYYIESLGWSAVLNSQNSDPWEFKFTVDTDYGSIECDEVGCSSLSD